MVNKEEYIPENAIAIIAMGARLPGAKTLEDFWNNLYNGVESVKVYSKSELEKMGVEKHLIDNPKFIAADAVLSDIDLFDASFFDYSAREAEITDPQHRLFIETAWEVLEKAGYTEEQYDGRISVFAGANLSGYMIRNINTNPTLVDQLGSFKIMLSNGQDFLATKVSHKMNLKGPSVNVNTLCSSSLVALNFACKSLLNYESDISLAGAVSIQITRNEAFFYTEGGIGSTNGHVRAYDKNASGTVSGSGLGILALKRLEDAISDGDQIEAVIRGTGINNDGAVKNSYTAPSVDGQADCIAEALAMSEVDPETIDYIDGHGTGTNLGDPIEISALTKAYRAYTNKKQYCAIGSLKTNIGHLVHAGGVASVIKTVLAMQHETIPATLNFEEPNEKIDFINSPFYVNSKMRHWNSNDHPRRAAVSSFGIGGTNTHVILEEAPKIRVSEPSKRNIQLLTISAKTKTALDNMSDNLLTYLKTNKQYPLDDIAFTLGVGRKSFAHRKTMLVSSRSDLIKSLENNSKNIKTTFVKQTKLSPVFYLSDNFYRDKSLKELYETERAFKANFDNCFIKGMVDDSIKNIIFSDSETLGEPLSDSLDEKSKNIALFITQYALTKMLIDLSIVPNKIVVGNKTLLVAATISNSISIEQALGIINNQNVSEDIKTHDDSSKPSIEICNLSGEQMEITLEKLRDSINKLPSQLSSDVIKINSDEMAFVSTPFNSSESIKSVVDWSNDNMQYHVAKLISDFWLSGGFIDFNKYYSFEKRNRIKLPTYPFERQRYWIEPGSRYSNNENVKENTLSKRPRPELETLYVEPRTEAEKKIAIMCGDLLGFDKVGLNDDFFELGGHSLLAVALIAKLRKEFSKDISLVDLFEHTTVAQIAPFFEDKLNKDEDIDEGTI